MWSKAHLYKISNNFPALLDVIPASANALALVNILLTAADDKFPYWGAKSANETKAVISFVSIPELALSKAVLSAAVVPQAVFEIKTSEPVQAHLPLTGVLPFLHYVQVSVAEHSLHAAPHASQVPSDFL